MGMANRTSFRKTWQYDDAETTVWHHSLMCGGWISVCERRTGFGWMDTETGYKSPCGGFWLASGDNDIREVLHRLDSEEAMIEWVVSRANNCTGQRPERAGITYERLMRWNNWTPPTGAAP